MLVDPTIIKQGNNYHVQHGNDAGLYVEFYVEAVEDKEASEKEGRPIFKDKDFITIHIIGDKNTIRKRPVRMRADAGQPSDPDRWPAQWAAFKNQQTPVAFGTPITEWAAITKSEAMSLKALNIHTVDSLAALGDNNLTWFGARPMRDKAKAWLAQAKDGSGLSQLQAENKKLRDDMEALQNQMQALIAAKAIPATAPETSPPKKRGPKPKNQTTEGEKNAEV